MHATVGAGEPKMPFVVTTMDPTVIRDLDDFTGVP